jgi:hypothetical protein
MPDDDDGALLGVSSRRSRAASRLLGMAGVADSRKARKAVEVAQAKFEQDRKRARKERRKAFAEAQKAGLSLRDIGDAAGLHRSRVAEIIRDE